MRVFGYDIRFQKNTNRKVKTMGIDFFSPKADLLKFSNSEVLSCQTMISDRLVNAEYSAKVDFIATKEIFEFIQSNRLQLLRRLFFEGFVIVNTESLEFVDTKCRQTIKTWDGKYYFELLDNEILQTSETFEATGHSDSWFLCDKLRFLDVVNSSDLNLIENYGAMGVVSPESDNSLAGAELDRKDIEEMQEEYRKSYGINLGKWSLMFVPKPIKYTKIDLPIAQLKLEEKRLYALKAIYSAFGIPKELSVYFESTKYANRNEAELDFYSNTISKWADLFITIIEKIYNNIKIRETYLLANEFWYDFVGVLALQEHQKTEKEGAREELRFWQAVRQTMPEHAETANARIDNLIRTL